MKIVIAAWHLRDFNVGIGRYTRNLIEGIGRVDQENEYEILIPTRDGVLGEWPNIHFRYLGFDWLKRPFWEQLAPLCIGSYDLLHFPYDSCIGLKRGKFVATIHDVIPLLFPDGKKKKPWKGLIKRLIIPKPLEQVDHVLTVSHSSKRDIMERLDVSNERITVVYQGVEPERFCPLSGALANVPKTNPYIFCVSGNGYNKNASTLIHAYAKVNKDLQRTHQLVLAGNIVKEKQLAPLIKEYGLEDRIRFTGVVSDKALVSLYQGASLFVFPSLYEGFGFPVLEAMACGCPVITSNTSSLPEVVGEAGVLVDPLDASAMSGAMERVLTDQVLAQQLRNAGVERAKLFNWDRTARETIALYRKVVGD